MFLVLRMLWSLLSTFVMNFFPSKPKDINGKVVLITGAAGGIGQQLAYKFALCGVRLALVDLNEEKLKETTEIVKKTGVACRTYGCDVSKREQVARLGAEVKKDFETVDILLNNAGVFHVKNFLRVTDSEIRRTIEVNLLGTIWMVQEFLAGMTTNNSGHIVNISSLAGVSGFPLIVDYCASKFGVKGFGEALAADMERLGKTGVHITTVYPGLVDTPLVTDTFNDVELVLGNDRLMKPEYVADKVVEGVLVNKIHIFIPENIWRLGMLTNLLPVQTMKMLTNSQRYGFYEK